MTIRNTRARDRLHGAARDRQTRRWRNRSGRGSFGCGRLGCRPGCQDQRCPRRPHRGRTGQMQLREVLGFDSCIDHRAPDLAARLATACPKGIDVYFENVGGAVFEAVFPLLNPFARIPVCGLISMYNATSLSPGPILLPHLMRAVLTQRLTFRGFIVFRLYRALWGFHARCLHLDRRGTDQVSRTGYTSAVVTVAPKSNQCVAIGRGPYTSIHDPQAT